MKKILLVLLTCSAVIACKSDNNKIPNVSTGFEDSLKKTVTTDSANFTTIQWLDSTYLDLGKQKEGNMVEVSFRFKNSGEKNLVIGEIHAQCGCTIPEQLKKPFAPGEEGVVRAKFNGSGHGETRKEIYVSANIKPYTIDTLTFRAELVK